VTEFIKCLGCYSFCAYELVAVDYESIAAADARVAKCIEARVNADSLCCVCSDQTRCISRG
jgi:hypothetical protein